jgi:hypothetical protein
VTKLTSYEELPDSDLVVDGVYEAEVGGQLTGETLSKLMPGIGNMGGFRAAGVGEDKRFVVLYSSGEDKDWPDTLDLSTGQFTYYGDNKTPGHELHDTKPGGNRILRRVFHLLHGPTEDRCRIPPFFVFKKYPTTRSPRSVQFKGLAVPGFRGLPATSDLVAVWKTTDGERFQNYKAAFTILDVPVVRREWLLELNQGNSLSVNTGLNLTHFSNSHRSKSDPPWAPLASN